MQPGEPSTVQLKVVTDQVKYLESLPLHHTQEKIESNDRYSVFQFQLVPTYDFEQEVLRYGPNVEVLAPDWFREQIADDVKKMTKLYD